MPNPPQPPLLTNTGNPQADTQANVEMLWWYLSDLAAYLQTLEPNPGWSTSGVVEDKSLAVGDSLTATQHFLGTLVATLKSQNALGA